eukprot:scaffold118017_cov17-Prasinocladus_malaysianus.AAC.1
MLAFLFGGSAQAEGHEVVTRAVCLFQPLAIAWATLARRGMLPGTGPPYDVASQHICLNQPVSL